MGAPLETVSHGTTDGRLSPITREIAGSNPAVRAWPERARRGCGLVVKAPKTSFVDYLTVGYIPSRTTSGVAALSRQRRRGRYPSRGPVFSIGAGRQAPQTSSLFPGEIAGGPASQTEWD